jgi:pimeloyl-ACP methyl ester carboxylesterase
MAAPAANPVHLQTLDVGKGPAVLLLHGVGGDHTVWNAQVPSLSKDFRVLAPDLRGHGRSPLPPGSTGSFPEMLGDLKLLLSERELSSAHFVGLSAGAFLALYAAVVEPPRVQRLVLSGGATHCDAHTRAIGKSWTETYQRDGFDAYLLRLVKDLYAPEWIETHLDRIDALREELRDRDYRGAALWGNAIQAFDLRGRLGRMKTPTLILQGMDDHVVDPSHARLLRQTISGTRMRLFPLTGHMVPIERPEEATQAILGWLKESAVGAEPHASPNP